MKTATETKTIIAPIVHMNGTGKNGLTEPIDAALDAIRTAYEMLKQCGPNGRDYYNHPQAPQAMEQAQREHRNRLLSLHNLSAELEALWTAIEDGETTGTYDHTT